MCNAALRFAFETLRTGGHFICKFYQGSEDKAFESRLKVLFVKVHREKPDSSRNVRYRRIALLIETDVSCRSQKKNTLWHYGGKQTRKRKKFSEEAGSRIQF